MKLVTYARRGSPSDKGRLGALVGDRVVDLTEAARLSGHAAIPATLKGLIEAGPSAFEAARKLLAFVANRSVDSDVVLDLGEVRLLPPVVDPGKFFCVGKNNKAHREELVRNRLLNEAPAEPTGFIKLNSVMVGSDATVCRPRGINTLDYEPELVFVIGRHTHRVRSEDALSHVVGIMVTNDLSARQIQRQEVASGTRFWTAKNMPGFGPVGPFMLSLDEVDDPHDLWITCRVNGELRLRAHTGDVIFRIGDVLEHFSRWMPFEPGDMIAMGAPAGVAVGQPNADDLYLKPGDTCEVAFEGMLPLTTHIVEATEM